MDFPITALNIIVKSAILLSLVALILHFLKRYNPGIHYAIWRVVIITLLIFPLISTQALYDWHIDSPDASMIQTPEIERIDLRNAKDEFAYQAEAEKKAAVNLDDSQIAQTSDSKIVTGETDWFNSVFLVWICGALLLLIRTMFEAISLRYFAIKHKKSSNSHLKHLINDLAVELNINRPIEVIFSQVNAVPLTFGSIKPVIVLPESYRRSKEADLKDVVLHEMIHIKRFDYVSNILLQLVQALYWVNPFVWIAGRELRLSCELSCDTLVLRHGANSIHYANQLLNVAKSFNQNKMQAQLSLPIVHDSDIKQRLENILYPKLSAGSRFLKRFKVLIVILAISPMFAINLNLYSDGPQSLEKLIQFSKNQNSDIRAKAALSLGEIDHPLAYQQLLKLLEDPSDKVKEKALYGLSILGNTEAFYTIEKVLKKTASKDVTIAAIHSLKRISCMPAFAVISSYSLGNHTDEVKQTALAALKTYDPVKLRQWIIGNTNNKRNNDWMVSYMKIIQTYRTECVLAKRLTSNHPKQALITENAFDYAANTNNFQYFAKFLQR